VSVRVGVEKVGAPDEKLSPDGIGSVVVVMQSIVVVSERFDFSFIRKTATVPI
jgi:hypothetical protein